jgi:hypothetical protein
MREIKGKIFTKTLTGDCLQGMIFFHGSFKAC